MDAELNFTFGNWLFAQPCEFLQGAQHPTDVPLYSLPEIAFWGRSNVGKSSLLNALTNRLKLAKISNTPGRTQQLNFFKLAQKLILVDMPGYGFAKAPKSLINAWQNLINHYIQSRIQLKRIYILIDARHGLKENDIEVMRLLDVMGISYQIILTKIDKIKRLEQESVLKKTQEQTLLHPAAYPQVIATSSEYKWGIEQLRATISSFIEPN